MNYAYFLIPLLSLIPLQAESLSGPPKFDEHELVAVGMSMGRIGGDLWGVSSNGSQKSGWSRQSCTIGYRQDREGGFDIIPVLILPDLENDTYKIVIQGGVLRISKMKMQTEVVTIDTALLKAPNEGVKNNLERIAFKDLPQGN